MATRTVRPVKEEKTRQRTGGDFEFVIENPPATVMGPRRPTLQDNLRRAMEETPGQWCRVVTYTAKSSATGQAASLREGKSGIPDGEWEITTAHLADGRYGVYAKYLGEKK